MFPLERVNKQFARKIAETMSKKLMCSAWLEIPWFETIVVLTDNFCLVQSLCSFASARLCPVTLGRIRPISQANTVWLWTCWQFFFPVPFLKKHTPILKFRHGHCRKFQHPNQTHENARCSSPKSTRFDLLLDKWWTPFLVWSVISTTFGGRDGERWLFLLTARSSYSANWEFRAAA